METPPARFLSNDSYIVSKHLWFKAVKTDLKSNLVKEFVLTLLCICVLTRLMDDTQTMECTCAKIMFYQPDQSMSTAL